MQRPTASGAVSAAPPAGRAGGEDRGLVDRAQAGDAGAFETLVRRYQGWVFTLALRMVG
ncbi:MAG: RNA polymerase sigma factor, partial [candidate division NC10 bacterium]|nr:RNA polymerase sigma factor [candidate division NC10 bacterium]